MAGVAGTNPCLNLLQRFPLFPAFQHFGRAGTGQATRFEQGRVTTEFSAEFGAEPFGRRRGSLTSHTGGRSTQLSPASQPARVA